MTSCQTFSSQVWLIVSCLPYSSPPPQALTTTETIYFCCLPSWLLQRCLREFDFYMNVHHCLCQTETFQVPIHSLLSSTESVSSHKSVLSAQCQRRAKTFVWLRVRCYVQCQSQILTSRPRPIITILLVIHYNQRIISPTCIQHGMTRIRTLIQLVLATTIPPNAL